MPIAIRLVAVAERRIRRRRNEMRWADYVDISLTTYTLDDFHYQFRMHTHTFERLILRFAPLYHVPTDSGGRAGIELKKALLLFSRFLGTQETYNNLSILFGLPISSVFDIIRRVCSCFLPALSANANVWSMRDRTNISRRFSERQR